jgi:hypothetical protein
LWVKILKFFYADPDPGIFLTRDTGWKKSGYGINMPDPQHCFQLTKNKKIKLLIKKNRV